MSYSEKTSLVTSEGMSLNPATDETQQILMLLLDRLEFGLLTDTSKRLKVTPEQATAGTLNATVVLSSGTLTNQSRIGDILAQRLVEAQLDSAYILGIMNNITF